MLVILLILASYTSGFGLAPRNSPFGVLSRTCCARTTSLKSSPLFILVTDDDDEGDDDLEDEEDDEDIPLDPYQQVATSEFEEDPASNMSALTTMDSTQPATTLDWGGALSKLRERVQDVETGKSQDPSHVLFRVLSSPTPNQLIGRFVTDANPQVVQAMSGAVQALLGGLSSPQAGIETIVKASGDKIGSLCFQLQMTGYMFRNAEYVLALRDILRLESSASIQDYKDAFDRVDSDNSGYIESHEVRDLLSDIYENKVPNFEIDGFIQFFDSNNDGKVSWEEFEQGLGTAMASRKTQAAMRLLSGSMDDDDEDDYDDEIDLDISANVSGTIEIELEDGKVVEVEAKEYINNLKEEAESLKAALRQERGMKGPSNGDTSPESLLFGIDDEGGDDDMGMSLAEYIASRQGDVKSLTEGVSPEIMDTMKQLVNFVLEGGDSGKATKKNLTDEDKKAMQMEIPGTALQQLALWQLVLGYRLREAEVKGDYMKLLE